MIVHFSIVIAILLFVRWLYKERPSWIENDTGIQNKKTQANNQTKTCLQCSNQTHQPQLTFTFPCSLKTQKQRINGIMEV